MMRIRSEWAAFSVAEMGSFVPEVIRLREPHKLGALSAGERQRTAVALALINRSKLILADEPTGNLDPENGQGVFRLPREYRTGFGFLFPFAPRLPRVWA